MSKLNPEKISKLWKVVKQVIDIIVAAIVSLLGINLL